MGSNDGAQDLRRIQRSVGTEASIPLGNPLGLRAIHKAVGDQFTVAGEDDEAAKPDLSLKRGDFDLAGGRQARSHTASAQRPAKMLATSQGFAQEWQPVAIDADGGRMGYWQRIS
jgi:hypothetical protein